MQQLLSANENDRSRGKVRVRHPNVDHNAATLSTSCLSRLNNIKGSAIRARGSQDAGITQPRAHLLADPCSVVPLMCVC